MRRREGIPSPGNITSATALIVSAARRSAIGRNSNVACRQNAAAPLNGNSPRSVRRLIRQPSMRSTYRMIPEKSAEDSQSRQREFIVGKSDDFG